MDPVTLPAPGYTASWPRPAARLPAVPPRNEDANPPMPPTEMREVFDQFVGQTFYGQMLAAMRQTVSRPAYFHGGRAEEVFQSQLDQVVVDKLSRETAHQFTGPMFDLFMLNRG